jgi:hypothetical protein
MPGNEYYFLCVLSFHILDYEELFSVFYNKIIGQEWMKLSGLGLGKQLIIHIYQRLVVKLLNL